LIKIVALMLNYSASVRNIPDVRWGLWMRALVHAARQRGAIVVVLAAVALTAAWDTSRPALSTRLTVVYVGAADCAPCGKWQNGEGASFRSSAEFMRVDYREIKSPKLRELLSDDHWPADLRGYRDQIGRRTGVPAWLLVGDGEILVRGSGPGEWRDRVLPAIKMLAR
jgi:hypothetical protein